MRISDLEFRRVLFRSREPGGIDLQPVALSEVNHVQRHHQRQGELLQLQNEAKVIVEVRRVDHRNDGIRAALSRLTRSEEHTSELQSLMRNSYAVFCLKKKKEDERGQLVDDQEYKTKRMT